MKTESMLRSHPRGDPQHSTSYAEAIDALAACVAACTACADACLAETEHVARLRRCIRTDLDCADVCAATLRVVTRQTETPSEILHAQLQSCVLACRVCADECETHRDMHAHCRMCAEACRRCQERCNHLLGEVSSSGVVEDMRATDSPSFRH